MGIISDEPELIGCEYDPSLQQQRAKHPEQQSQTQAGEQALKVHVLQVGVRGSAELHHLETSPQQDLRFISELFNTTTRTLPHANIFGLHMSFASQEEKSKL